MKIVKELPPQTAIAINTISEEELRGYYILIRSRQESTFGILLHEPNHGYVFRYKEAKTLGYHGYFPTIKEAVEASLNRSHVVIVMEKDLQDAIHEITA